MSKMGAEFATKVDPGSDCTLRNARSLAKALLNVVNSGSGVEIDCAGIEQADITFVQTIVSTERSCAARGLSFTMLAATESVRSAFERAGIALPGASQFAPSGN